MSNNTSVRQLPLGIVVATPTVVESIPFETIVASIERHRRGDWGEVSGDGIAANEEALTVGGRMALSIYGEGESTFWIITEPDRSVTTVLFPEER